MKMLSGNKYCCMHLTFRLKSTPHHHMTNNQSSNIFISAFVCLSSVVLSVSRGAYIFYYLCAAIHSLSPNSFVCCRYSLIVLLFFFHVYHFSFFAIFHAVRRLYVLLLFIVFFIIVSHTIGQIINIFFCAYNLTVDEYCC